MLVAIQVGHFVAGGPVGEPLQHLTEVSRFVYETANMNLVAGQPYVGSSAFAHKGGMHVAGVNADARTFEHIDPAAVGNDRDLLISELSGKGTVQARADAAGMHVDDATAVRVVERIKTLEHEGFQFEAADGSFEMLVRRSAPDYQPPFELLDYTAFMSREGGGPPKAQAMVRLKIGDEILHTAAEAEGPVNALDRAIRKALLVYYPELA